MRPWVSRCAWLVAALVVGSLGAGSAGALAEPRRGGSPSAEPTARASALAPSTGDAALASKAQGAVDQLGSAVRGFGGQLSARVVLVPTGVELAARGEHLAQNPASNAKLWTAYAALRALGPQHRFVTTLAGAREGSVVPRLVLIGTGDPSLRSADLVDMALELRALGVRKVTELAVDQSAFDDVHVPPAFEQQPSEWAPFRAPVSAVAVDGNTLTLRVVPGKVGELALVEATPPGAVVVRAAVRTVAKAKAEKLELSLSGNGTQVEARVSGTVPAGERHTLLVRRLDDPALAAGLALKKALVDVGVAVGEVKLGARASEKSLVTRSSRPLAELVTRLGKESDNFYAEQIFKALGAAKREPATASRAAARVEALLREAGALDAGTKVRNGSGLFDASRATAAGMTELLRVAALDARVGPELMGSLAIGGVDGTLRGRLGALRERRAVRAKTGTLEAVVALSGYVLGPPGRGPLAFSFLVSGAKDHHADAKKAMDASLVAITEALWAPSK
jgi:D-alanyl-D-alanine carboxypeptidase/D-alanyl-D-alanine-endopeptidase (penicillin-binding protein 4)